MRGTGFGVAAHSLEDSSFISGSNPGHIPVKSLALQDSIVFAGTCYDAVFVPSGGGAWRRPLSELMTDTEGGDDQLPSAFCLFQNYPNPFNPSTTISYQLPASRLVILKVCDILGREIATSVSERPTAGATLYALARPFFGGVCFYSINTGTFRQVKKMFLMK